MALKRISKNKKKRIADIFEKLAVTFFGLSAANSVFMLESTVFNYKSVSFALFLGFLMAFISYHITDEDDKKVKPTSTKKGKL
jgi:hypothetical protein